MSRKTIVRLLVIILVIAILETTIILVDLSFVVQGKTPKFCINRASYENEMVTEYTCFGYKVIKYKRNNNKDVFKLVSIFKSYDEALVEQKEVKQPDNKITSYNYTGIVTKITKDKDNVYIILDYDDELIELKIIPSTLIYKNNYNSNVEEIEIDNKLEVKCTITDSISGVKQAIVQLLNIVK